MDARRSRAIGFAALVGAFGAGALTGVLWASGPGPMSAVSVPVPSATVTAAAAPTTTVNAASALAAALTKKLDADAADKETADKEKADKEKAAELTKKRDELRSILLGYTGYVDYPAEGSLVAAVNTLRAKIVRDSTPRWCEVPAVQTWNSDSSPKPLGPPTREACKLGPSLAHVQELAAAVDAGVTQ